MKFKYFTLPVTMALAAGLLAACGGTATNVSINTRTNGMTNLGTNNANIGAVVVNTNSANMNSNRWSNSNVSREDYDRSRADYERDRGSSTIGSGANDSWLWFKTRTALLTTNDLRESTINVDVVNDVITLKGTVATQAQKTKAAEVANAIEGKKSVVNQLTVAPNDSMTNTSGNTNANQR